MKLYWIIATICTTAALSGCSLAGSSVSKMTAVKTTEASSTAASSSASETEAETDANGPQTAQAPTSVSSEEDEEDLNEALFRSAASTAQMEITTGLTPEYLDMICSYPVTVFQGDKTTVLEDLDDLDAIGLKTLYTDELLKAVGEADPDKIVIVDDTALLGDPEGAYIVLGKDVYDVIGITEFHYPQ